MTTNKSMVQKPSRKQKNDVDFKNRSRIAWPGRLEVGPLPPLPRPGNDERGWLVNISEKYGCIYEYRSQALECSHVTSVKQYSANLRSTVWHWNSLKTWHDLAFVQCPWSRWPWCQRRWRRHRWTGRQPWWRDLKRKPCEWLAKQNEPRNLQKYVYCFLFYTQILLTIQILIQLIRLNFVVCSIYCWSCPISHSFWVMQNTCLLISKNKLQGR